MPNTLFPRAVAEAKPLLGRDEMVRLTNSFDWSRTELGPMAIWPEALRSAVRLVLASEVPMVLLAGKRDGVLIYNRGYAAWPEVAEFNAENMRRGFAGETWYLPDQELHLNRTGRLEPAWMNLNHSPVMDDAGNVLAVLAIVVETTARYLRGTRAAGEPRTAGRRAQCLRHGRHLGLGHHGGPGDGRCPLRPPVRGQRKGCSCRVAHRRVHARDLPWRPRDRVSAEIADALKTPGPVRFEYRLQRGEDVRWVVASGRVIADESGRALRLPGVMVDVTDERRIAEQLAESEMRFRTLADTMPQMVWSTLPDGFHDYYNARWYEFTGVPEGSTDGEGWNGMFHPDDQERAWQVWRHSLETGEPYAIEYRLRHRSGEYRWVLGQALPIRDAAGRIVRWFGTLTDIHETKLAQEEREVVAQELSHRIKNIFAVIGGIVALAARTYPEASGLATELRARTISLGKAHDFVRPHSSASAHRNARAHCAN